MSGLRLRVLKDGTRPDKRLCDMCQHAIISKGPQQGQEIVRCEWGRSTVLRFPVVECNQYMPAGQMDESEARRIGWVLEVKKGIPVGFRPPKYGKYDDD